MDSLVLPSDEDKRKAYEAARQLPVSADGKKWRLGEQDFEALMKHLDNVVSHLSVSVSEHKDDNSGNNRSVTGCSGFA